MSKPLNTWEQVYIPEIIRGLGITSRHFFVNLWRHTLQLFGLAKDKEASVTIQYPEVRRTLPPRTRTLHRLMLREDGTPKCVACMMCETACPADCIHIVAGEHPDARVEKYPKEFRIDLDICVYCGFCEEACPEDAIRMDTGITDFAAYDRMAMRVDREWLMSRPKMY
jgi:NADH-quinone oxidoreductase subunit I